MQSAFFEGEAGVDPESVGIRSGMLWSGPDLVLAGFGVAARLPIDRADGISGARNAQQALEDIYNIDECPGPGRGLIAFGAFPFDPGRPGELVIPQVVIGRDGSGRRWLNIVGDDPAPSFDEAAEQLCRFATEPAEQPRTPASNHAQVSSVVAPEVWRDEIVREALRLIGTGVISKVVLAREIIVAGVGRSQQSVILRSLLEMHSASFVFANEGFVGASPELLVARNGDAVFAHPLAGTAPRGLDSLSDDVLAADLLKSTKNRWEHRITIDWLLEELLPFCSYVDAEPDPSIMTLPNVHHLGTRVEGRLSAPPASALELVAALHPTPAVGGRPQAEALTVIGQIERAERGRYAGPVGWVDAKGNGEFAVGIRSAEVGEDQTRLFAGVGIVADSDPQAELDETEAKFGAMLPALLNEEPC